MEFALSEDQGLMQDSLRGVLSQFASLDQVRQIAEGDAAAAGALETALVEFGLASLLVPEDAGGLGLGLLDACLVQEALGYHVAPSRFLASALAATALADHPVLLDSLAVGAAKFGAALTELFARRDRAGLTLKSGKLAGTALLALSTEGATHLLAADAKGGVHVVDASAAQTVLMQTIDRTRVFHEVTLGGAKVIASAKADDRFLAVARLLTAADTLGAAQAMIDKAVAYAAERQQFGRVIGSFQAVKHMCAEMAAKLEPGRALIWHAAHALDLGDAEGLVMANLAKAYMAEAGTFIARTSTEVHGGMGFTDLVGLHYWYKRIGVNRQLFGSPEQARETAAALQGLLV